MLLNNGYNPYFDINEFDDLEHFGHSQFLQPPIVAQIFRVFSLLPYSNAKTLWFIIQLIVILVAIGLLVPNLVNLVYIYFFLLITLPIFFWPIYTHLERGQTDIVTLFFIFCSYGLWLREKSCLAGIFLAIGSIFKLPVLFLFSVPLASYDKKFIFSGILTFIAIIIFSIGINGYQLNRDYFFVYLPTIAKTGSLPDEIQNNSIVEAENEYEINGVLYENLVIGENTSGGSITRFTGNHKTAIIGFSFALMSIILFLYKNNTELSKNISWIFAMISILLFHPMTHVMNYIWMLFILPTFIDVVINIDRRKYSNIKLLLYSFFLISLFLIGLGGIPSNMILDTVKSIYSFFELDLGYAKVIRFVHDILYQRVLLGSIILYISTLMIMKYWFILFPSSE